MRVWMRRRVFIYLSLEVVGNRTARVLQAVSTTRRTVARVTVARLKRAPTRVWVSFTPVSIATQTSVQ